MGFWWVIFQRGEYMKLMDFDGFWKQICCCEKLSAQGVYVGKYGEKEKNWKVPFLRNYGVLYLHYAFLYR